MEKSTNAKHAAEGAALGFYYQSLYALLTLVELTTDDAAIGVEQLDDVELTADGRKLLFQLKHSVLSNPTPLTIKSVALWRTIGVWIDALPSLSLAETSLHLITVGGIPTESLLHALTDPAVDRSKLALAMTEEAERVVEARAAAAATSKKLPHADRADACGAFLGLTRPERLNLLRRIQVRPNSPTASEVEQKIAEHLELVLPARRSEVARRLVEWWDRQVLHSLCGLRERVIARVELQSHLMEIIGDLEHDRLVPEFESVTPPEDYQPDGTLTRQIELVKGKPFELGRAIREEWRAREQRALWLASNPAMASKIAAYDEVLQEHWSDRHDEMVDACAELPDDQKCASGLEVLRWTHNTAPSTVRPIDHTWEAPYYVRGSYQVLSINLKVGWHPDYKKLLGGDQ
ncbi:MAG: hypothetical protein H6716_23610 [Polyangiaceae bacterium]|nr:hypothetical protein [Polyangiaceae bacterium]